MKTSFDRAQLRLWPTLCCVALVLMPGCRAPFPFEEPAEAATATDQESPAGPKAPPEKVADAKPVTTAPPAAIKNVEWVLSIVPAGVASLPEHTWRNAALEPLAGEATKRRDDLTAWLADGNPIVAANAAILLARCNAGVLPTPVRQQLIKAIRNQDMNLPMRCAAAESLTAERQRELLDELHAQIKDFGDFRKNAGSNYLPTLHAALLRALIAQSPRADEPEFVAALESPAFEVRRTVLEIYIAARQCKAGRKCQLPEAGAGLHDDLDPRVRSSALRAMAVFAHPDAHECLRQALGDFDPRVRLIAIASLGQLGSDEARQSLEKLRNHPSELSRAAAVSALAVMKVDDAVLSAAHDKSARVRQAVAEALADAPSDAKQIRHQAKAAIRDLLTDASGDVQQHTVKAMARWPLPEAGPMLLTAIEKGTFLTRKAAAAQLAQRWPSAAGFPVAGTAERRGAALAKLRAAWIKEFGALEQVALTAASRELERRTGVGPEQIAKVAQLLDQLQETKTPHERRRQIVVALEALGPDLITILENREAQQQSQQLPKELFEDVLPKLSPVFASVERLTSNDSAQRRAAAEELLREAAKGPLSPLAMQRFTELMSLVNDPVVWQTAIALATSDPRKVSAELAYMAIGNASVEVRRRACEYLAAHGDPKHVKVLMPVLEDPNSTVVAAAVRALGASGYVSDTSPLVHLLSTPDKQLRGEVATCLVRLGAEEGPAALERLAKDTDPDVRRRVAIAIGELADPVFLPVLIDLLEDRNDIQRAVLHSLTIVTGRDMRAEDDSPGPPPPAEQCRRWQRWYREQAAANEPNRK